MAARKGARMEQRGQKAAGKRRKIPASPAQRASQRVTGPAGEIIVTARRLFEAGGVKNTTVKAIAAAAGMSRELVYYYFPNKTAVVNAVVDDYVEDMIETAMVWNELREFGDTPASLRRCILSFRHALFDGNGMRPMIGVLEELGIRDQFDTRAVKETARYLNDCVAAEYAAYHHIEIDLVYEMFCVILFGLVGLVKACPDISDDDLMKVVEQTLHLDMQVLERPDDE
ncbi:MAG: TetR/AcrR family transcriptional regulator [Eggerthellaceae bacterium]|nr:TetR/AcrR family transcriptional regulator [Eggerthellaceae bacterium]